jgi:uncharacterized protein (DUF2141 family)
VLDSLTLRGKVTLAENGAVDSTLIVVLHTNLTDSAVRKDRPRYVTRLDGGGNFTFRNLPADTFAVYALSDAGGSRRYLSTLQTLAFANEPVAVSPTTKEIVLYAYKEAVSAIPASSPATRQNNADRRLRFTTNLSNNQQNLLDSFIITFDQPLRSLDSTKISLSTDSVFNRAPPYSLVLDTARKHLAIKTAWRPGTLYNLILDRDFAEDTLSRKLLKTDTLFFNTRKQEDYGNLNVRVRNIDTAQNPVLQFVQNGVVFFSTPIKSGRFTQTLFLPGDYDLRILYDRNRNGKWDPGQFFNGRKQPELALPINRRITVKAASDNDFEVSL